MELWNRLERSFNEYSGNPALTDPDGNDFSYGKLLEKIHRRQDLLRNRIPAGSKIAVLEEHPFEEALSFLSLLALRVTVIPLAKKYGDQRNRQIIRHTKPDFLYSHSGISLSDDLITECESAGTSLILGESAITTFTMNPMKMQRDLCPFPSSFIMYTSGSTGQPKGAILTHRNIAANIADIQSYFEITSRDHLIIHRSLCHASVLTGELLSGLISGARLTFYHEPFIPRRLLSFMERLQGTILCTIPTVFHQLASDPSEYRLPELRKVALMGEYLHQQVALKASKRFPHVQFYMNYGQTEASPRISYLPPRYFTQKEGCIGLPLPSMEVKVVDEEGETLETGQVGELIVKGPNVFAGYWDDPELTLKKVRDGWLHTGDAVYRGEDGYLYFAARKDDMIIRAGMNVYPKEIEEVLLADERIRETVVYGAADLKYGQKIYITVVPALGALLTETDIVDLCRSKLSPYQYPDAVEITNEIPRNASGKIIRKREGA